MSLIINWDNRTPLVFNLVEVYEDGVAGGHMKQSPDKVMIANSGKSYMDMEITLQVLLNKGIMYATYQAELNPGVDDSCFWFSIQAIQPVNVAHIGYKPYYQVCSAMSTVGSKSWKGLMHNESRFRTPVSDPSEVYNFTNAKDHIPSNLAIQCRPISGGSDLTVNVIIQTPRS